ncbi:hypothetical protein AN957_23130 [Cytobacillus solani]|uniref:Uncharacterized protein n=1 Tax=Cytobacillus solani TaxID=1637975 RepID=A0A0Q3VJU5_9BACI|nr:hypothetical protein AN957_23130 [Cytobacillus solani]
MNDSLRAMMLACSERILKRYMGKGEIMKLGMEPSELYPLNCHKQKQTKVASDITKAMFLSV